MSVKTRFFFTFPCGHCSLHLNIEASKEGVQQLKVVCIEPFTQLSKYHKQVSLYCHNHLQLAILEAYQHRKHLTINHIVIHKSKKVIKYVSCRTGNTLLTIAQGTVYIQLVQYLETYNQHSTTTTSTCISSYSHLAAIHVANY